MQFDFHLLKEKFPLITQEDLQQMKKFFETPQTQTKLEALDRDRKQLIFYCAL